MSPLSLAFSCRSERSEGGGISVRRKSRNIQLELLYHVFVHIDTDCSTTGGSQYRRDHEICIMPLD